MVLVLLQLDAERALELLDGAGQHDHAFQRVDALDRQVMLARERLGALDVVLARAEVLGEILARHRLGGRVAAREPVDQGVERLFSLAPQHHRHMYPFGRIAGADALGFGDDLRLAACVKMPCHVMTLQVTACTDYGKSDPACRMRGWRAAGVALSTTPDRSI